MKRPRGEVPPTQPDHAAGDQADRCPPSTPKRHPEAPPAPRCDPPVHCDDRDKHDRREDPCRTDDAPRLTKVVERIWYFGGEPCEGGGGEGGGPCPEEPCKPEPCHGRPTRPQGTQTGRLGNGNPLNPGDLNNPLPPGVWVGPRADMDLPYLFMRANAGDTGKRPITNAPFWESPDIFILAGVTPSMAPAIPPQLGQTGLAGQPNTIYAHVWNFGNAAANEVLVEFYWCNPSLGIDAGTVQLIAQTTTSLGSKSSGHSHAVVMCPEAWTPTFVNGGHECLLVRVWDNPSDLPGEPLFDASANRHVAQRNIHVVAAGAGSNAMFKKSGASPSPALSPAAALQGPLTINVGALYGAPAQVKVERVAPHQVPWLQQHTGKRGVFPAMAPPTGAPTLSPPTSPGSLPAPGEGATQTVTRDGQQLVFTTSDNAPGPGEAHAYRVSATQAGAVFGGYTIVILG